ncbi:beta-N-acetylhexosaminidase [uncultured Algimonas sp.]|uniref:beta-N-acetylhexosaminidase n=1 Tax=uncultured Algimonas sp. TaxID=1547920 RepID=UPI002613D1CB|nr:beta-N-acetylhexosaminidase [uncultured Algimonas sp.]
MSHLAAILGLSGTRLTRAEKTFFRDADPWAFILFARNVDTPDQLRRLCADLRNAVGRDALIFVDQEGGRVQRLKAPHWRAYPTGAAYAAIHARDAKAGRRAVWLGHRLIADDLRAVGITADCAPVLDLPQPGADPIISDRALGETADRIVDLAHAAMHGLMEGGVAPVIKHIPGHGRATVDSHLALPRIDTAMERLEETDFAPFRALNRAPMAMTAHAVYAAVGDAPVTISAEALQFLIRERIGFDGLLMSDDLDMKALSGDSLEAKTRAALDAGCDVALQCSGQLPDMIDVAKGGRPLSGDARARAGVAEIVASSASVFDRARAEAEFDALLGTVS